MQIDSPESVRAEGAAHVNITKFSFGDKARGLLPAFLALSVIVNIACLFVIRDYGTEERLKQYNLDWFRTHEFSDLKAELEIQKRVYELNCRRQ